MSGASWGYFVYYRIDPQRQTEMPWTTLFGEVARRTGVAGRLYGPAPDGVTWMEVYEPVPDANRERFETELAEAAAEAGLDDLLPEGERRHVEAFQRAQA